MNDAVRFAVCLVDEKDFEGVFQGAPLGAMTFEQSGGVADDFGRVTEEKKPLVVELAEGKFRFPAEWSGLIIREVEIVARTSVTLFWLAVAVQSDAEVIVHDHIFTVADDFRPLE